VLAIDPAEFDVDDRARKIDDVPVGVGPDELPPGAASGLLLHDVLEAADLAVARDAADAAAWARDPDVATQLADAARARGIPPRFLPHAARLAHATLAAPIVLADGDLLPPLVAASGFAREVEFAYPLPAPARGLVKGYIDALVAYDDELWVLDYKSDVLAGPDLGAAATHRVREHYAIQARLYAIAADRLRGRRKLAGLLFGFVRYGITVAFRVGDDTLGAWVDWLGRIAGTDAVAVPDWKQRQLAEEHV
jgi:ATP-dependent exoDNAse (exonuclease V) beta subunit